MLHHLIEPHLITVLITVDSYVYTIVQNNSLQNGCRIYRQLFATNYIGMTIDFVHPHVICTQDPARGACCLADPTPPFIYFADLLEGTGLIIVLLIFKPTNFIVNLL